MKGWRFAFCVAVLGISGCVVNKPHLDPSHSYKASGKTVIDIIDSYRQEQEAGLINPELLFSGRKKEINGIPTMRSYWCTKKENSINQINYAITKHCIAEGGTFANRWCISPENRPIFKAIAFKSDIGHCNLFMKIGAYAVTGQGVNAETWLNYANQQMSEDNLSTRERQIIQMKKNATKEIETLKQKPPGTKICEKTTNAEGYIDEQSGDLLKIITKNGKIITDKPENWRLCERGLMG